MAIDVFPVSWRKLWKEWELRFIILLSLTCQIILMLLGNRRRYTKSLLLRITLWSAYTAADSFATFALGAISSDLNDATLQTGPLDASLELEAFWTPFFLLHLGGLDTITAYSVEDNELWLRQWLNFVVQTGMVIYVLLLAWSGSHLSILSILILVAGIINYGERTYALWCASYKQRTARVSIGRISDSYYQQFDEKQRQVIATSMATECLFADVPGAIFKVPLRNFVKGSCTADVELVELGIALMYDGLYTKTKVSHSAWGAAMRCLCFLLTCISLVLFCVLYNQEYSKIDLSITFALLTTAILKELYGAFAVLTSYTTLVWFRYFTASKTNVIYDLTLGLLKWITALSWLRSPTWSNSMGQCSLMSYFLRKEPQGRQGILKLLNLSTKWKKGGKLNGTCHVVPVLGDMKQLMYDIHLKRFVDSERIVQWGKYRGILSLENEDFWSSILLWHFVTEIWYSLDVHRSSEFSEETSRNMMYSKYISRYMMYLVVMNPEMLSSGWEHFQQRFSDLLSDVQKLCSATVKEWSYVREKEAMDETETSKTRDVIILQHGNFMDEFHDLESKLAATSHLSRSLRKSTELLMDFIKGETRTGSVLAPRGKWQVVSWVWMEMLTEAAIQRGGNQHAQLMSQGGELLTKNFGPDRDIYMYRGDQGFCSVECRNRQIVLDEMKELEAVSIKQKLKSSRLPAGTRLA